ncbi:metallophosphoesterase [Lacticaseibacillus yichunensis]|uniref:Metallophosphoesterase n=1 Tax=Lacticaseibacillus yichunensis TaxID=2486015 RepID=A0ABW4CTX7_9LACO|nr:metallophosphoesterase [Lacticaseibacillus yichunensis]
MKKRRLFAWATLLTLLISWLAPSFNALKVQAAGMPVTVAQYHFDGDYKDTSGNGHDGIPHGTPTFSEGVFGQALHIQNSHGSKATAADQYVRFAHPTGLQFGKDAFAVSLWYQTKRGDSNGASILGNKDYNSGTHAGFVLGSFGQDLRINLADGHTRVESDRIGGTIDGQWHYIVANYDRGGDLTTYKDGKITSRKSLLPIKDFDASDAANLQLTLGADGLGQFGLDDALIDELTIYRGVVPEFRISAEYAKFAAQQELNKARALLAAHSQQPTDRKVALQKAIDLLAQTMKLGADATNAIAALKQAQIDFLDETSNTVPGKFTFNVFSDVHLSSAQTVTNFQNALKQVDRINPDSQAVIMTGDNTDNGKIDQYNNLYDSIDQFITPKRTPIVALGNHDVRWQGTKQNPSKDVQDPTTAPGATTPVFDRYLQYNRRYMANSKTHQNPADQRKVYWDQWVGGYHFLVLNTERDLKDQAYLSDEQIAWVDKTIAQENDPSKPGFLSIHQTFEGYADHINLDRIGGGEQKLKNVLKKYPQAVIFTGHIHSGPDMVATYHTEFGHIVDVPAFIRQDYGSDRSTQLGYQVTVDGTKIHVRIRNYATHEWIYADKMDFDLKDRDPQFSDSIQPTGYTVSAASLQRDNVGLDYLSDSGEEARRTNWKSAESSNLEKYGWVDFAFKQPTAIDGIRYTPKNTKMGTDALGTILSYRVDISTDGGKTYRAVGQGNWQISQKEKFAQIKKQTVTNIRLVPLATYGMQVQHRTTGYVEASHMAPALLAAPVEKPSEPGKPEVPGKPETPQNPGKPETPVKPEAPKQPEVPSKPETPNKPETPSKPETPVKPETPGRPDTPSAPKAPAKPAPAGKPNTTPDKKPTTNSEQPAKKVVVVPAQKTMPKTGDDQGTLLIWAGLLLLGTIIAGIASVEWRTHRSK